MAASRRVCPAADVPPGAVKVIEPLGDEPQIVIRNEGGTLHAIENVCPHRGGPVGEGDVDGNIITCPWHGWSFDLTTGQNTMNPAAMIRKLPCRVEGPDIVVDI